jgi:hypothetical protein
MRTNGTYTYYTLDTPSNGLEITLYTGETTIPENPANPDAGENLDIDQPQPLKSIQTLQSLARPANATFRTIEGQKHKR